MGIRNRYLTDDEIQKIASLFYEHDIDSLYIRI